jgi:hypothetical protein
LKEELTGPSRRRVLLKEPVGKRGLWEAESLPVPGSVVNTATKTVDSLPTPVATHHPRGSQGRSKSPALSSSSHTLLINQVPVLVPQTTNRGHFNPEFQVRGMFHAGGGCLLQLIWMQQGCSHARAVPFPGQEIVFDSLDTYLLPLGLLFSMENCCAVCIVLLN